MELEAKFRTEFLKSQYRIEFKSKQIEDYSAWNIEFNQLTTLN